MSLCQYKDALGIPGQGIHSYRFMGIAIVDMIATIVAAVIISFIFKFSFIKTFILLFIFGEFLHYIFCVKTTIEQIIFHSL